jgi:phosphatidylglycerol:prolipoprotein diacylglycerol transferase
MRPWIQIGELIIPSFVLVQSLNACLLLWWTAHRAQHIGLPVKRAVDLGFVILICGVIGGRLLHVLWESPELYSQDPLQIFNLLSGGYVYFGGFLFAMLGAWLWFRVTKEVRPGAWFDFFAPIISLGTAIGRIGCFLAGCCYGKICNLPWAMPFVDDKGLNFLRHPTQLYSVIWELGVLMMLLGIEKGLASGRLKFRAGSLFVLWMVLHSLGRFFIEFLRDDFRGKVFLDLSISQWISLAVGFGGCLILRHFFAHPMESPKESPK